MLLVKTKLGVSPIAGIGLFADQSISKGTYIWRFKKGFDIRVDESYADTLNGPAKDYFLTYAYQNLQTRKYILCSDNARFLNHSNTPNIRSIEDADDEDTADIAARDIQPGEELTIDYREFDTDPYHGFDLKEKQS